MHRCQPFLRGPPGRGGLGGGHAAFDFSGRPAASSERLPAEQGLRVPHLHPHAARLLLYQLEKYDLSHRGFICIFPVISNWLFILSFISGLFHWPVFLIIRLFVFTLLVCSSLDIIALPVLCIANILHQSVACLLILYVAPFNIERIFEGLCFLTTIVSVARKHIEMTSLLNLMCYSPSVGGHQFKKLGQVFEQEYNLYS